SLLCSFLTDPGRRIAPASEGLMKNPFKPDRSAQDRDNPVVPNVVERPVERAVGDDRGGVIARPGIVGIFDPPSMNDGPGDRPGIKDSPADIARGRAAAGVP